MSHLRKIIPISQSPELTFRHSITNVFFACRIQNRCPTDEQVNRYSQPIASGFHLYTPQSVNTVLLLSDKKVLGQIEFTYMKQVQPKFYVNQIKRVKQKDSEKAAGDVACGTVLLTFLIKEALKYSAGIEFDFTTSSIGFYLKFFQRNFKSVVAFVPTRKQIKKMALLNPFFYDHKCQISIDELKEFFIQKDKELKEKTIPKETLHQVCLLFKAE